MLSNVSDGVNDAHPQFALFYAKLTSAGSPDPVTFSILHHRPDWFSAAGPFWFVGKR